MTRRHPYEAIDDFQRWSRAVTWVPPGSFDPVVAPRFSIGPDDKLATLGSCFAQHLSRHLAGQGFNYFVPESAPATMPDDEAARHQYGTFSARYGSVYTIDQAVQLFDRAEGRFVPDDEAWERNGRFVDPFRPLVEPDAFESSAAVAADRALHLAATRRVFAEADVIVFTLGLTEGWRSRIDGAVYPTAPGVNGGSFDPERHEFFNTDVDAARASLAAFCERLHALNPGARLLLTVSPVPLIATAEHRHVAVSTAWSKAVLRIAAEAMLDRFDWVDYFPSFEIITMSPHADYYAPDRREVLPLGVAHVMRSFHDHYVEGRPWRAGGPVGSPHRIPGGAAVVCDEETVEAAIRATGR